MTDALLARLGDLRDEMDRALSRFQTSVDALGPTTGSDKTEAVTVRLDRDGALRSVAVTSDWKTRVRPVELGLAVVAAYGNAVANRLELYAVRMGESDSGPPPALRPAPLPSQTLGGQLWEVTRDSDPESAAATEAFGTFLHEVNEDIARALGSLRAQRQATYSASSPARHVTVTVNSGGVLQVVAISTSWVGRTHPTNIGREITQAALAATETARTSTALALLSEGVLNDIQRLSSDPIALAQRLGLR